MTKKIVCVIPARLDSTRFPEKMLALLGGKHLVRWAFEGAKACGYFHEVVIATDSVKIAEVSREFGAKVQMTDQRCRSGTDRLIELQREGKLHGDIWVNWQGDEPFVAPQAIEDLLQSVGDEDQQIWTLKKAITSEEEIDSPHTVKVVTDHRGRALYFSRSPIPSSGAVFKHVGLYAFRSSALEAIGKLSPCLLENEEKLEQLRFLYYGLPIQVHETSQEIFGIDTKEELARAEAMCYNWT